MIIKWIYEKIKINQLKNIFEISGLSYIVNKNSEYNIDTLITTKNTPSCSPK